MRRALPAAGIFVTVLGLLDPIRLPELAAGLAAAAGAAAVALLLAVVTSPAACRRHSREALPPAAGAGWYSQPPTQPMFFEHPPARYRGPDLSSIYEAWLDGHEGPPVDWDAVHLDVARDWGAVMRRPDEVPGSADMTEFEQEWKLP